MPLERNKVLIYLTLMGIPAALFYVTKQQVLFPLKKHVPPDDLPPTRPVFKASDVTHQFNPFLSRQKRHKSTVTRAYNVQRTQNHSLQYQVAHNNLNSKLMLFIHSAVLNFQLRTAIRETWGSKQQQKDHNFELKFFIGYQSVLEDLIIRDALRDEVVQYSDIVIVDIVDSYVNLTEKSMKMLQWCLNNCDTRTSHFVKMDDDVFINIPHLKVMLQRMNDMNRGGSDDCFMIGYVIKDSEPIRERFSKYYMPKSMFKKERYPPYLSGSAYLIPIPAVQELVLAANNFPSKLWLEDIFITGILPQYVESFKLSLLNSEGFNLSKEYLRNYLVEACKPNSITVHGLSEDEMRQIWTRLQFC